MFKRLLDYNSPENVWLRNNQKKGLFVGGVISACFMIPTIMAIVKESKD